MLHILLLILKIIGIIIAVILGIVVLLFCVILFVPFRYEGRVKCNGQIDTLKAKARVTWFFHLVRADAYFKDRKLKWKVRIAWKRIGGGKRFGQDSTAEEGVARTTDLDSLGEKDIAVLDEADIDAYLDQYLQEKESTGGMDDAKENESDEAAVEEKTDAKEDQKDQETQQSKSAQAVESIEKVETVQKVDANGDRTGEGTVSEDQKDRSSKSEKAKERLHSTSDKIKGYITKIKCTIKDICDKINALSNKKDKVSDFIKDETHIKAFCKVKKEVFKLLKKLRPKRFLAKLKFGFDDPAYTGYVLALLALWYPTTTDHLDVRPDFENKVLKGTLHAKGKVRVSYIAIPALRLLLPKCIRTTYRDIKNFEL